MMASVLTAFFFALSAVTGSRAARLVGPVNANFIRLSIATLILTVFALTAGKGLAGPGLPVFLMSGLIGFGLGDIALFHAYERLGARRTILLAQCGAVPFAILTELVWLGTVITWHQLLWIALILGGICLAVLPRKESPVAGDVLWKGAGFGILAALGQAWGAVLSRKAVAMNDAVGLSLDGWTSSFQRILAGLVVAALFFAWFHWKKRSRTKPVLASFGSRNRLRAALLCLANALAGPVLGVGFYQWALSETASGIVLAVVATTPVVTLPLVWVLGEDKPEAFPIIGSLLAVGGVVGLLLL